MTHPIHAAAKPYLGGDWRYGHGNRVAYPWPKTIRATLVAALAAEREIDCTTLAASVVMRAYPAAPWRQTDYDDLQIMDADVPSSPTHAVVRVGIAEHVEAFVAESWHLVQGWRVLPGTPGKKASGHCVLVYDRGNGTLDVLESTSLEGNKGPRFKKTTVAKMKAEFPAALFITRFRT